MQVEKTRGTCFGLYVDKNSLKPPLHEKNYTLRYLYNLNETFFHLFMHTKVYDKITNENIEKHGILLRSWNPITKRGERYIFKKGEEGEGDLNLKKFIYHMQKQFLNFLLLMKI